METTSSLFKLITSTGGFSGTRLDHPHGRYSQDGTRDFMAARLQSSSLLYFRGACGRVQTAARQRLLYAVNLPGGTHDVRVPLSVLRQLCHDDALQAAGSGGVLGRGQC